MDIPKDAESVSVPHDVIQEAKLNNTEGCIHTGKVCLGQRIISVIGINIIVADVSRLVRLCSST